jgi:hypothetical protein
MQVEPWEIELRNQFGLEQQPEVASVVVPDPANSSSTFAYIFLLIGLALACLYVYDDKTGSHMKTWAMSHFQTRSVDETKNKSYEAVVNPLESKPLTKDAEIAKLRTDLEKSLAENKGKYEEIAAKLNITSHKVALMGLLLNENFNILNQNRNVSSLMFFNRDWTLDRMPKYIELSEDDVEYLKKFVKQN